MLGAGLGRGADDATSSGNMTIVAHPRDAVAFCTVVLQKVTNGRAGGSFGAFCMSPARRIAAVTDGAVGEVDLRRAAKRGK